MPDVTIRWLTGIRYGSFPFIYLGCPIFNGRKKKSHFESLVKKVSWDKMCYPKEEGGLGFRSLYDISKALFEKLWWNFRTTTSSPWGSFMWNKYCKKLHPILAKGQGTSHVWRKMTAIREEVEHNIWWQLKEGKSSFWFDNWTKQGALYYVEGDTAVNEELEVRSFSRHRTWDIEGLRRVLSEEMIVYIVNHIKPPEDNHNNDAAWWMGNSQGFLTVNSAWKLIVSRCWCCEVKAEETMTYVFLTAPITKRLWRHFAIFAGINMEDMHLQQLIIQWWSLDANPKLQLLYRAVPTIIMSTIWRRGNNLKHEKTVTFENMVEQVEEMLRKLVKGVYPWIRPEKANWPHLIAKLQNYKPKIYHHSVVWQKPERDKVKCNTDGASKGNPGEHRG
ncbi:hypothetical protein KY289_015225 [Solanum tuberosum]|nr:hypothetical protein KY289_015225 [Solanum tuberosum]